MNIIPMSSVFCTEIELFLVCESFRFFSLVSENVPLVRIVDRHYSFQLVEGDFFHIFCIW